VEPTTQIVTLCYRCHLETGRDVEFCPHCGAKVGIHRAVPWWHIHRRLSDWTLGWAYRPSAGIALMLIAFAESSCFPLPPDVLLMPLCLGNKDKWLRYALMCTGASVVGGMVGYLIGYQIWHQIQPFVFAHLGWMGFTDHNYKLVSGLYDKYDFWAVAVAGFTPIPYKVFTILAGVCSIKFPVFVLASIIGRGGRFLIVAGLMRAFGARITPFIEKYFNLLTILFTLLLIGGFAILKLIH